MDCFTPGIAQISNFPYVQNFDSVAPPALPPGWSSTQNRILGTNDFTTGTTTPRSTPASIGSTNATITQSLISPLFDFSGVVPDSLVFYIRRSATHNARMLVEASLDSGRTFPLRLGDSLTNTLPNSYVQIKLNLPSALATSHAVKFRWRIVADGSGNTGTLRMDDVMMSAMQSADLSLDGVRFQPLFPAEADSVLAFAKIKNVGQQSAQNFSTEFYVDANNDSIPQTSELRATVQSASVVASQDSIELSANLGTFSASSRLVIAKAIYAPDQNLSNNQRNVSLNIGYRTRSIVVNEIMYVPNGTEPEWVELFNTRTDSINLKSWSVSDNLLTSKHILTTQNVLIPPAGYILLTRDSAALVDVHPEIRSRVLNVSGFPSLNNTGDAVVLYDGRTLAMDSVAYLPNWGGSTNGNSLERIDPAGPSTSQANWGTSRNPTRSTPGARNSLTRKDRDLALDSLRIFPAFPVVGDSIRINVPVRNIGRDPVLSFVVRLYRDANADSLPQPAELLGTIVRSVPLLPLDSTVMSFSIGVVESHLSIATVSFSGDEDTTNNIMYGSIVIGYPAGSVRVNEIMYAPTGTEPEWIEVVNTRTDSINLKSWTVSDNIVATKRTLTTQNLFIPSNGYVVLTRDSAALLDIHPNIRAKVVNVSGFPSLNNTGDAVVLYDQRVATMDSVSYLPGWGGSNGNSLERIDFFASSTQQTNWGTSHDSARSTPGHRNSIARKDHDLSVDSMRYQGPQFPVVGDEVRFIVTVKNPGREPISAYAVHWYHDVNADSIPQPGERRSTSNFTTLNPLDSLVIPFQEVMQAGTQLFIARVEFVADEDTTNNTRVGGIIVGVIPGTVCINEVMYAPGSGTPEWVELYNMLSDTVDLQKWLLGNRSATPRYEIAGTRLTLPPNDFIVLTKDTALFRQTYSSSVIRVVQVTSLPTFLWNNSGDAVVLVDNRKFIMDSVFYHATWGGTFGKSLERIDPRGVSNDSTNWGSSTDSLGATPGRRNSQLFLENDLRVMRVLPDTISPGQDATIIVVLQNAGMLSISSFDLVLFDDVDGDSVGSSAEQFFIQSISQPLASRDSLIFSTGWARPSSGIHRVIAQVNYGPDQRLSNNEGYSTVRVGFPERALVINEIMFAPMTNNAEYVEFYNASQVDIDLAQWKIHDRISAGNANEYKLTTKSKLLRPGETFTLASDSTIFRMVFSAREERLFTILNQSSLSLNNEGDDLVLIDPAGLVIDSVRYSPSWHNPNITDKTGRSLEKINPLLPSNLARNWTTSTHPSGGTPGRQNSVYAAQLPAHSKLSISPNPFSPDGDGREDFTIVQYEMPLAVSTIRARIFDSVGRRIRSLANNEASGARGSIVWDGLDDDRQKARIGIYILLLEAIDERGGVVETVKGVVVLAAKL